MYKDVHFSIAYYSQEKPKNNVNAQINYPYPWYKKTKQNKKQTTIWKGRERPDKKKISPRYIV